ncbi:hypothetical protein AB1K84_23965, partial [Mesobacillus foraminis]|uniref:hypothetical protein n=1 Tax=Mesobacillus foraminis TaxID=279826 RepID=UPI0039A145AE
NPSCGSILAPSKSLVKIATIYTKTAYLFESVDEQTGAYLEVSAANLAAFFILQMGILLHHWRYFE